MTVKRQAVIDFIDLRFLSIECSQCGTKLVLDVAASGREMPEACPACHESFGSAKHQIGHFIRVYNAIKESGSKVRFEIDEIA